ncbi:hypothetical protein HY008_00390 [Candidatus Woesebacteria bacterium]|nr:hypothetical protein [Candidatus Woesebacteria bacterium]
MSILNKLFILTSLFLVIFLLLATGDYIKAACSPGCTISDCGFDPGCSTCSFCPAGPNPGVNIGALFGSRFGSDLGFGNLVSIILSNAIIVAAIIMLFLLIFGGISIIVGAGRGDEQSTARGRQAATAAAIGFAIIFGAYWIVRVVETIAGFKILEPGF